MTTDQNGNTISYDAENRMIKIVYPGTSNYSTFVYDGLGHNVEIVETRSGSVTSTQQFVWCGSNRCEARNSGGSVTAQFFGRGEVISGTSYFYSKDRLGSIHEMTNSSGTIEAQYSYDPYGRTTLIQGSVASDRQYAGYYLHTPSGLCLTWTRAYSANLGRFINRDKIGEAGGTNLFAYVLNTPTILRDSAGLTGYPSVVDATAAGAQTSTAITSLTGQEAGGVAYPDPTGGFMPTLPIFGGPSGVDVNQAIPNIPIWIPSGSGQTPGDFHSHPDGSSCPDQPILTGTQNDVTTQGPGGTPPFSWYGNGWGVNSNVSAGTGFSTDDMSSSMANERMSALGTQGGNVQYFNGQSYSSGPFSAPPVNLLGLPIQ